MSFDLALDPSQLLPILIFFSYVLILSLTLLNEGMAWERKWYLALYCGLAALAMLSMVVDAVPFLRTALSSWALARLSAWAMSAWPVAFYFLTLAYLGWDLQRSLSWVLGGIWLVMVTLLSLPVGLLRIEMLTRPGFLLHMAMVSWALALAASYGFAFYQRHRTSRPRRHNRIEYWLLVTSALLLGCLTYLSRPGASEQAGMAVVALTGWIMAYAILRQPLVDLKELIRHGAGYLVVTILTVAVYFVTISVVQAVFSRMAEVYSRFIGVTVAAITLTVLYEPMHSYAQQLVDRLFFGLGYDQVIALQDYVENIDDITDLEDLAVQAVTLIAHAFGIERGALLNLEPNGPNLIIRVIPGMEVLDAYSTEVTQHHPLITYFQETGAPLRHRDLKRAREFQNLPAHDKEWLAALNMEVFVPIKIRERLLGIFALGPKSSGEAFWPTELELLSKLGDETALALRNAQRFAELATINVDIAQLNEELRRLDQAKSNFLTIASHELKTPLTLIQGYTNILTTLPASEMENQAKIAQITDGITRGTERLRQIIDDMIDISRLDANALTLHWKECRLSHVLGLVAQQLGPAAEERSQTLILEKVEHIPLFEGDAQRLHQALRNVVENAIKFTPDGGRISLSARLLGGKAPEEQFIEVVIADTGIGIAPEDQERIFEKFYRVGDARLHSSSKIQFKGGGPGLGLAIAKGIIEAHGGKIWAASEGYDEDALPGSEFHILLMVKSPDNRARLVEKYGGSEKLGTALSSESWAKLPPFHV